MNKEMFMCIVYEQREYHVYYMCKKDCTGLVGFISVQKCIGALRCVSYGDLPDTQDDYICMFDSTSFGSVYKFGRVVV
jgi:hypothetical protein